MPPRKEMTTHDAAPPPDNDFTIKIDAAVLRPDGFEAQDTTFSLEITHHPSTHQALLWLSQDLPLRGHKGRVPFFILVAPENILQLNPVGQSCHDILGETYQLHLALRCPPDLVGPALEWQVRYHCIKQMQHLKTIATLSQFTLFLRTRDVDSTQLSAFCRAASNPGELQSHSRYTRLDTLYGGKGCRKYPISASASPPTYGEPDGTPSAHPPSYSGGSGMKRRRSGSDDEPLGSSSRKPCPTTYPGTGQPGDDAAASAVEAGDLPAQILNLHRRLDALESQLINNVMGPLHQLQVTHQSNSRLRELHTQLHEWLSEKEAGKWDNDNLEDAIAELQEDLDKVQNALSDVEIRVEDLDGACQLEVLEAQESLQEWVKDYIEESLGELLDDALAVAFKNNMRDAEAATRLLQEIHKTTQAVAGRGSPPSDDATTPSSDGTESSDFVGGAAREEATKTTPNQQTQTTLALQSIARSSERVAAAFERIARACEKTKSDVSTVTESGSEG